MAEVQQDYDILGGSVLYRLLQRGFPKWFKFNSIYVMQPMYLPKMNIEIAKQFGTIDRYSLDPPATPPKVTVLSTQAAISVVVKDAKNFKVSYDNKLADSASADFLLYGSFAADRKNQSILEARVKNSGGLDLFSKTIESKFREILAREAYKLRDLYQVDFTKEYEVRFGYWFER